MNQKSKNDIDEVIKKTVNTDVNEEVVEENEVNKVTLTEKVEDAAQWKEKYLRVLADYQNLEKRSQNWAEEMRKYAAEGVLRKLLPVFDNFVLAGVHLRDAGLDLAIKELIGKLGELGVSRIEVLGKQFNPEEMECVEVVDGEKDRVTAELRAGYKLHERVLRVAQVKVGESQMNADSNAD